MKSYNNLYSQICSYQNLWSALHKAKKGRRTKDYVQKFEFDAEKEIVSLHTELCQQTYLPGKHKEFYVFEPKKRMISAAPFRDRVVHHALCNVIAPLFEKKFIFDSYANREGKGTHSAVERYQFYAKKNRYVLKCDIKKYFPSIDHAILKSVIRKTISCPATLWLIDTLIDHSNHQDPMNEYFNGDTLFSPYQLRRGLPIGNLTSQFFANVYLNEFDHYIKEELQQKAYIRYVDDFAVLSNDKEELNCVREKIEEYLTRYRLTIHNNKSFIQTVQTGVRLLGFTVYPEYSLLHNQSLVRFRKRIQRKQNEYREGTLAVAQVRSSICGWLGHVIHCNSYTLRKNILSEVVFTTG